MTIFVLYLLAKNPACQERLRTELEELLCGGRARVTADTISEALYLKAVLKESFRWDILKFQPYFAMGLGLTKLLDFFSLMSTTANIVRIMPEEIVLSGFKIPAGVSCTNEESFQKKNLQQFVIVVRLSRFR